MKVTVRLFAHFRSHLPGKGGEREAVLTLADDWTVGHLIEQLGMSPELPKVILVNGEGKDLEERLHDGDTVSIFPPVGGGSFCLTE